MLRIVEAFTTIRCRNPISGHEWTEQGDSMGYDVVGGKWIRQRHRTLKAAEKDKSIKESIDRKFPQ